MGIYLSLGRRKAIWIEFRKAWLDQSISAEKIKNEWLISLPSIQVVYTE